MDRLSQCPPVPVPYSWLSHSRMSVNGHTATILFYLPLDVSVHAPRVTCVQREPRPQRKRGRKTGEMSFKFSTSAGIMSPSGGCSLWRCLRVRHSLTYLRSQVLTGSKEEE